MLSKTLALTSIAALAGQSLALNAHRNTHEKRSLEVVWETVWSTVYVTDCDDLTQTTTATTTSTLFANPPATSTLTSSTTLVLPSSSTAAAPPPVAAPPAPQSTLTTSVQPATTPAPAPQPPVSSAAPPSPSPPPPPPQQSSSQTANAVPTSVPAPAPAPAYPAGPGEGKRGLAYNDPALANSFGSLCPKCTWAYNWGPLPGSLDPKYSYVPMLWGTGPEHTSNWDQMVSQALDNGCKAITSFNEPDNAGQAALDPTTAAHAHAQYMNKYAGKVLVGAPSVTNSGSPGQGVSWLAAFMAACNALPGGCAVDFCPVHWYSPVQYSDTLFDHLENAHQACAGRPIWLTEFAPQGSDDDIAAFLRTVIPKLEALPYLAKYSYFMVSQGSLLSSPTSLSAFGEVYASL